MHFHACSTLIACFFLIVLDAPSLREKLNLLFLDSCFFFFSLEGSAWVSFVVLKTGKIVSDRNGCKVGTNFGPQRINADQLNFCSCLTGILELQWTLPGKAPGYFYHLGWTVSLQVNSKWGQVGMELIGWLEAEKYWLTSPSQSAFSLLCTKEAGEGRE